MECRYDTTQNWYKGSLHLHTTHSDGHLEPPELINVYAEAGFDFIAITDHWKLSRRKIYGSQLPLVVLDGVEIDGNDRWGTYYHVVIIGPNENFPVKNKSFTQALETAKKSGAITIWAHPHWTGNTSEDGWRHDFSGLEIYNHTSHCENGSGYALSHWDNLLTRCPNFLGFATDDSHFSPGEPFWKGGWVMINAPVCDKPHILEALRRGNFYSTQGPQFHSIECVDNVISISTSPVEYCRLIGPRRKGHCHYADALESLTNFQFNMPTGWPQMRIEIEDKDGRRAWTNPVMKVKNPFEDFETTAPKPIGMATKFIGQPQALVLSGQKSFMLPSFPSAKT